MLIVNNVRKISHFEYRLVQRGETCEYAFLCIWEHKIAVENERRIKKKRRESGKENLRPGNKHGLNSVDKVSR